jgi:hypothetical protein
VRTTFASLFAIDPQACFLALFTLVGPAVELNTRTKGLEFLQQQLKALLPAVRKDEAAAAGVAAGLKGLLSGSANALIGREELKFFVQTLLSLSPHHANAAKIRTDEPLKAELAAIALAQSGLHPSGALDLTNEAAIKHFLSVQSVVNNLASVYGVDTAPFLTVYFKQILPNLEQVSNVELRSQLLRAVANNVGAQSQGANKLAPKQAQALFPAFYALFKKHVPLGEVKAAAPAAAAAADGAASAAAPAAAASGAQPEINFATAEVFLYLFHLLAAQAPSELRAATGIFTPTGQPGEFAALNSPQREEFNTRIAYLLQSNAAYKETLHAVQKRLQEELKEFNKQNQQQSKEKAAAAKAAKKAGAAPAVAAGQPAAAAAAAAGEKKEEAEMSDAAASAAADASAVNTAEDKSSVVADLRSKLASINAAIRISASVAQLAKPLQDKPLPTLLTAEKMSLSWRENRAPSAAAGGAAAAAGGKQQQQQKKGGQQQQQQAKQAQKGQKRKSDGGGQQQQSQSHKKQQQQSGSQKKGGNQQQQQQQQNKRQKQQPNGGGQSQSNKGGQRRRR